MTTFHDALSGKKLKFDFKTKSEKSAHVMKPWCEGCKSLWDHSFPANPGDFDICKRCGATAVYVKALRNGATK